MDRLERMDTGSFVGNPIKPTRLEGNPSSFKDKRVLYILPQPFFQTRGSSFRALATIKGLAKHGAKVDVIAFPQGENITLEGVKVFRTLPIPGIRHIPIGPSVRKIFFDILLTLRAAIRVYRKKYDVIHGVEEGGIIAALLGRVRKVPYIFDMHSWMSLQLADAGFTRPRFLLNGFRKFENWSLKGCIAYITVGTSHADRAQELVPHIPGFILEDHALTMSPGDEYLKDNLRAELALGNRPVLLYTGNFESYQGIDLLLKSFSLLMDKRGLKGGKGEPPVLLLVGGGNPVSAIVTKYKKLASELRIGDSVIFAGQRSWNEMAIFMDLADVLVSPRVHGENTPLKIYSYMAAGKIIVATRMISHTQVLNDGNSLLADPTPEGMAEAMFEALDTSPESIGRHAERLAKAREEAEQKYSEKAFQMQIVRCYESVFTCNEKQSDHRVIL